MYSPHLNILLPDRSQSKGFVSTFLSTYCHFLEAIIITSYSSSREGRKYQVSLRQVIGRCYFPEKGIFFRYIGSSKFY